MPLPKAPGLLVLAHLIVASPLLAQETPGSFDELVAAGLLRDGDSVLVIEASGRRTEGEVAELTGASLTLLTEEAGRRTFPEAAATRIELRDSLINGILLGAAAGATSGFLVGAASCSDDSECEAQARAVLGIAGGAGGAALGALLDATLRRTVYLAPGGTARASVRLWPWLSRRARGLVVVADF